MNLLTCPHRNPVEQSESAVNCNRCPGDITRKAIAQESNRHIRNVFRRTGPAERNHLRERANIGVESAAGNCAWSYSIDANAIRSERARQFFHQHGLTRLGRTVMRQIARRIGVQRGYKKHPSSDLARFHMRAHGLTEYEPSAKANRDHRIPLSLGHSQGDVTLVTPWRCAMHKN